MLTHGTALRPLRFCVYLVTAVGAALPVAAQVPGLVGYWPLDEGVGDFVADLSTNANNGTRLGALWGPGYSGSALCFDGVDDGVIIPDRPSLDLTTGISVCAWIKGVYAPNVYEAVVWKHAAYWFGLYNGRLFGMLLTSKGLGQSWATTPLPASTWTFVAMTYDNSTGGYATGLDTCDGFQALPGNPIIPVPPPGAWDREYREIGNILYDPNDPDPSRRYKFTYSAYVPPYVDDQVWVGAAFSPDGETWTKYGPPIISRAAEDPYVVLVDGTYYLFAEDKADVPFRNIRRYHSSDFINWVDDGDVFDIQGGGDPPGWESGDVSSPLVWIEDGTWYLLYEGRGAGLLGRIGLATSTDGYSWTRVSDSPVLTAPPDAWDGTAQVPDDMVRVGEQYCMTYHGCNTTKGVGFWTGLAYSTDRRNWTRSPSNPVAYPNTLMLFPQGDYSMGFAQDWTIGIGRYQAWQMSAPKFYINGQAEVPFPRRDFQNGIINATTTPLAIGEQANEPHYDFSGYIDEVRLYDRALTPDEIQALFGAPPAPPSPVGDCNCDGTLDFGDINPFVLVLTDLAAWEAAYPGCPLVNADINKDGVVDFGDINPFVALLSSGHYEE